MEKSRLWTKDFITGTLTNFFLMLNYYLLVVIMSSFAMETFDAPPSQAGFSASIFLIGALAARMHCGRCIEHIGRKKLLIIGMVSSLIISLLYLVIFNIWALYAVRLIHGVAYGTASTAIGTIVAGSIPADRAVRGWAITCSAIRSRRQSAHFWAWSSPGMEAITAFFGRVRPRRC
jgi:MFS family permease